METQNYFDFIVKDLTYLREEVRAKSKLGFFDIHKHCEDFIKTILNKIYKTNLQNLNNEDSNYAGLDLGDKELGIAYQITSTKQGKKIMHTLKICLKTEQYRIYPKIRIFILTSKQNSYSIQVKTLPYFNFDPKYDIIDFDDIYKDILNLDLKERKELSEFISQNLPYRKTTISNEESSITAHIRRLEGLQTGGNSFCYCMFYHFDLIQNIAQNFCIIKDGEFPLYDVSFRICDMHIHKDILNHSHGELNSPAFSSILKWPLSTNIYYRFFFNARNGSWNQDLILKKSVNYKCWLAATIVRDKFGKGIVHKHIDNGFLEEFGEPIWKS